MLGCFLAGISYLGMTDRETIIPFAADYFKSALIAWAASDATQMAKIRDLTLQLGHSPHPKPAVLIVAGILHF